MPFFSSSRIPSLVLCGPVLRGPFLRGPVLRRLVRRGLVLLILAGGAAALTTGVARAQTPPPATDIILFTVVPHGDHLHARSLVRITERNSYDNQPAFLDEDYLVFASAREGDGVTDILRYSVLEDAVEGVTRTPESKYSPRLMPAGDAVSVVRVALDGVSQELVRVPLDGGEPEVILPGVVDVGYYAWIDEVRVALFRLGDPPGLHVANVQTGEIREVARRIGPVVQPVPGRAAVSFVQPASEGRWLIRLWDGETGEIADVGETPGPQPDHVWLSSSTLLSIHAGRVFRYLPGALDTAPDAPAGRWHPVLDDLCPVFGSLARLAVSPSGQRWALVIPWESLAPSATCM